jgi:hypothetical protein
VSQAIRAVKGVLQVDVSYLKKAAFVRASKPLCSKKGAQALLDAIKKLPKYKGEIYEIKPAKVQSPALHLLQRKLIRKPPKQKSPMVRPVESKKAVDKKKDDKEKDQSL